jgi:hypothetical protein
MMKTSLAKIMALGSMQLYSAQDDALLSCVSEPNDSLRLIFMTASVRPTSMRRTRFGDKADSGDSRGKHL